MNSDSLETFYGAAWPISWVRFDSPYQPAALTKAAQSGRQHYVAGWSGSATIAAMFPTTQSVITYESSAEASAPMLATGREFLSAGRFTRQVPSTPLQQFVADVRARRIVRVEVAVRPRSRNLDVRWTLVHCRPFGFGVRSLRAAGRLYLTYV
jgi:hypothetical protein